jgi:signal transduction histidine kinase
MISGFNSMSSEDLVDRLLAHKLFGGAPREELRWLAEHGELRRYQAGDLIASPAAPIEGMYVVFSGRLSVHVNRGAGPRRVMEWQGGEVTGVLPYSRQQAAPGKVVVEETIESLFIARNDLPAMTRACYEITAICVHAMLDRARHFTSTDFHDEKMLSLGRLAAGLAHELNNPVAAVTRSAYAFPLYLAEADHAARALGAAGLSEAQLAAVDGFRDAAVIENARPHSPIEKTDREEEIGRWLTGHGLDDAAAEVLADSPIPLSSLDQLAAVIDRRALEIAVTYVAADYAARKLTTETQRAASRISELVAAIKRFTYLDQASAPKPVDVRRGLEDTLMMLNAKAKGKSITLALDVQPGLPQVQAFGGELNQVWMNLVDNALDAAPLGGHVTVSACRDPESITIRVLDDGPGIPEEIRERIFEPFYTTKRVGEGTGLGLDIVNRLVKRHAGEIDVVSKPGRTEFRVTIPLVLESPDATRDQLPTREATER